MEIRIKVGTLIHHESSVETAFQTMTNSSTDDRNPNKISKNSSKYVSLCKLSIEKHKFCFWLFCLEKIQSIEGYFQKKFMRNEPLKSFKI